MFQIQKYNAIADSGLALLPSPDFHISEDAQQPVAILLRSHKLEASNVSSSVIAIGRAGAGTNNIPIQEMTERGIVVFNTPGANANAVKELVLLSLLLHARNIPQALGFLDNVSPSTPDFDKHIEASKKNFKGIELPGKTLGVIGLGAIGVKVANAAQTLGMRVVGFDPLISIKSAWQLSANVHQAASLSALLNQSDFISLHIPLTPATRHFIGADEIAQCNSNAVLLNFSRGEIIDKTAVLQALTQNKLAKYMTDFPTPELIQQENVVCLPHLGASTKEAEENCAKMVAKQIKQFLKHGIIENSVNFPEMLVPEASHSQRRLTIANVNVPNMVAQYTSILAQAQLNIVDFMNRSRDEQAFSIIDVDAPISEDVLAQLRRIEGVLSVRSL